MPLPIFWVWIQSLYTRILLVMEKKYYSVSEICDLFQITRKTLFYYDKQGLLLPSRRTGVQNFKEYDNASMKRLGQIRRYREAGISIRQIKVLLDDPDCNEREYLQEILANAKKELRQKEEEIRMLEKMIREL